MKINEKAALGTQFRFQLPMLICAIGVIVSQRKLIGNTLKIWGSWNGNGKKGPQERIDLLLIGGAGVMAFIIMIFTAKTRQELTIKQQTEVIEKMKEEGLITQEEIERQIEAERETTIWRKT